MKKKKIPRNYIIIDYDFKTRYKQDKKTGLLEGRYGKDKVKGFGDYTAVRRMKKSLDINRDGKIDYPSGGIVGRTNAIPPKRARKFIKASKYQRGYIKRI